MAIRLDSITRNTGIDPLVEPVNCTIAYSAASTTTQLKFGSFFGATLATGGSGSGSLTANIPAPTTVATINAAGGGGVSGWGVTDSLVSSDGVNVDAPPFPASMSAITQLTARQWQFGPAAYNDIHSLMGGGPISAPYDYWVGGAVVTYSLSRVFGGSSDWIIGLPYSSFVWDFGDGNTSTSSNPTHTYAAAGAYTITLTLDYAPFLVPLGYPGRTSSTTVALQDFIFMPIVSSGWYLGQIAMSS